MNINEFVQKVNEVDADFVRTIIDEIIKPKKLPNNPEAIRTIVITPEVFNRQVIKLCGEEYYKIKECLVAGLMYLEQRGKITMTESGFTISDSYEL